ncbi:MAG: polynucleotide adenylyltransferase PcnB [Spirochaetes bacterium]|nr:polynucleotide adenylyltransferase PcnB [Spirochaetota bacterium]
MFIRYRRDEKGRPVPRAYVYTEAEHRIDRKKIDREAIRIVERLKAAGYEASILGGAVRDLLQDRSPKDFDLVTDALPTKIKKLFRNARIIGKRFRLVHIIADGTIYEVSTFRSNKNGSIGNEFGSIEEDALRRDFTFNALYYDPTNQSLVDFTGGFKDLKAGKIKPILPIATIFKEDPVRIVRGVKYTAVGGFEVPFSLKLAMKRDAHLLSAVSPSRMTEEFFKILASGRAEPIFSALIEYKLVEYFVPAVWARMRTDLGYSKALFADLKTLDALKLELSETDIDGSEPQEADRGKQKLSVILSYFMRSWLGEAEMPQAEEAGGDFRIHLASARTFIAPMNPPRVEMEAAVLMLLRGRGLSPLQRPPRMRRRRPAPARNSEAEARSAQASASRDSPHT